MGSSSGSGGAVGSGSLGSSPGSGGAVGSGCDDNDALSVVAMVT